MNVPLSLSTPMNYIFTDLPPLYLSPINLVDIFKSWYLRDCLCGGPGVDRSAVMSNQVSPQVLDHGFELKLFRGTEACCFSMEDSTAIIAPVKMSRVVSGLGSLALGQLEPRYGWC